MTRHLPRADSQVFRSRATAKKIETPCVVSLARSNGSISRRTLERERERERERAMDEGGGGRERKNNPTKIKETFLASAQRCKTTVYYVKHRIGRNSIGSVSIRFATR